MKPNFYLLILITTLFFACENEELIEGGNAESKTITIDFNNQDPLNRRFRPKCPGPVITLSPCDMGFKFYIDRVAGMSSYPDYGDFNYSIVEANTTTIVDADVISYGNNTNQVLNYCTDYEITIIDWCWGPVTFTITSDGCNNIWLC